MAATANIMVSDAAENVATTRRTSYLGPVVLGGLAGSFLLVMGLPGLIAGMMTLEAREVVWGVYYGETTSNNRLLAAAEAIASGNRWTQDNELNGDRGLLLLRAAAQAEIEAERKELLAASTEATVSSLSMAPGQPSAWLRLAHLRHRSGEFAAATAALRMSMLSGSFVPAVMGPRAELGVKLLPYMDSETLDLLRRQVRLWWVVEPEKVAEFAARPEATALVREGLDGLTEADINRFQRLHGKR